MRLVLAVLVSVGIAVAAESLVDQGFDHFYNLEYDEALSDFQTAIQRSPGDPNLHNHVAQTILYRELFRLGALESELVTGSNPFVRRKLKLSVEVERQFDEAIGKAIELGQAQVARNPSDAAAHYALGVSYGLRANYGFLIRKAWTDSLRDATNARKEHDQVTQLDSGNADARMIQGAHEYVVGSLPWFYRMLGFVAGFRGNKQEGIATLEQVARNGKNNREDAKILLCAIYRRERRPAAAIPILKELIERYPRNYILRLEMIQMYSDLGQNDKGLEVANQMLALKAKGAPGYARVPVEKILLARGTLLFWYREYARALEDFEKVTARTHEFDLNTEVLSWLRLGQTYDMLGQREKAMQAYRRLIEVAPDSERASQARQYLRKPYKRS